MILTQSQLMNLIFEVVEEYTPETVPDDRVEKLRILDFDDTIAMTDEKVVITIDNGAGTKEISSQEFANYKLMPGESLDPEIAYKQFDRIDIDKAAPIPLIAMMLTRFLTTPGERKVLILTARAQAVEPFVISFIEERLGVSDARSKIEVVGVGDKNASAKVAEIKRRVESYPNLKMISFYDDSLPNVQSVLAWLKQNYPDIKRDIAHVDHENDAPDTPGEVGEDPRQSSHARIRLNRKFPVSDQMMEATVKRLLSVLLVNRKLYK